MGGLGYGAELPTARPRRTRPSCTPSPGRTARCPEHVGVRDDGLTSAVGTGSPLPKLESPPVSSEREPSSVTLRCRRRAVLDDVVRERRAALRGAADVLEDGAAH